MHLDLCTCVEFIVPNALYCLDGLKVAQWIEMVAKIYCK